MTIRDSSVARAQAGVVTDPIPDPQVPERSRGRRQFSAKYKARILDEYESLDKAGIRSFADLLRWDKDALTSRAKRS